MSRNWRFWATYRHKEKHLLDYNKYSLASAFLFLPYASRMRCFDHKSKS